jgi:hypothetical protein
MTGATQFERRKSRTTALVAVAAVAVGLGLWIFWPHGRSPCNSDEDSEAYGITVQEPSGNKLALRRSKNWSMPGLGAGKWIGTAADLGPGPSYAYHKLNENQKGCIKFKYPGGTNTESAWLHVTGQPIPLTYALYCAHPVSHPSGIKPDYVPVPATCPKFVFFMKTSVGIKIDSLSFAPINLQSLAVRLDSLRARLLTLGVPQPEADSLRAMVGVFGPWYPCASAGCCRAWGT